MSPKAISILYWLTTGLFAAAMVLSGIMGMQATPQNQAVMQQLGYPMYLGTILGVAKLLGAAVLLLPVGRALKEWAYAGFTIDVLGAAASWAFVGGGTVAVVIPGVYLLVLLASYFLWKQKQRLEPSV